MIRHPVLAMLLTLSMVGLGSAACRTIERGAAKDPQRCERDPTCTTKQDKSKDCATACVDNMECMQRCQQVTGQR